MTGSSRGGRRASLAPLRYTAFRRAIADSVAAKPTLHVREQQRSAKSWHDSCAAVCKLLKRPGPAERCWCGGTHPPRHRQPTLRAQRARPTAASMLQAEARRHLCFVGGNTNAGRGVSLSAGATRHALSTGPRACFSHFLKSFLISQNGHYFIHHTTLFLHHTTLFSSFFHSAPLLPPLACVHCVGGHLPSASCPSLHSVALERVTLTDETVLLHLACPSQAQRSECAHCGVWSVCH